MGSDNQLNYPLEHGGDLSKASVKYRRDESQWLDLSTGIAPWSWPIPQIPESVFASLPSNNGKLEQAAAAYYGNSSLLAVPGSQAAISHLPRFFSKCKVGVLWPSYAEHFASWQHYGHQVVALKQHEIDEQLETLRILVVVNPNNPTSQFIPLNTLLDWKHRLAKNNGFLIIDEAFIDTQPQQSFLHSGLDLNNVIVLRSLGKFFGLAGVRLGFIFAHQSILQFLQSQLGPWSVNHVAQCLGSQALLDKPWHIKQTLRLQQNARQLQQAFSKWSGLLSSDYFVWIQTKNAESIHEHFAKAGIWTRLFSQPKSIRIGLPKNKNDWKELRKAIGEIETLYHTI